ncbi:PH domain-containing protein [Streptomyces daliensis]
MTSESRPPERESASEPEPASESAPEGGPVSAGGPVKYEDRCYRSPAGMAGGALLLALGVWLGVDGVLNGSGRTPWVALAALLLMAPLVIAFTLRPAVYAGDERMRVRNPFRTVTVPWGAVESVRSGYSSEVLADGGKYQLWAIPVSLRARKKAARHNENVAAGRPPSRGFGLFGPGAQTSQIHDTSERRAPSDQAIDELRALAERHAESAPAQGRVTVRWAYEILAPALVGAVALAVLLGMG